MYKILTEPVTNVLRQQVESIGTEGVKLKFDDDAIREMARVSSEMNRTVENIGARRLFPVIERIVEEISYNSPEMEEGTVVVVNKELVEERVSEMLVKNDLSKFIL